MKPLWWATALVVVLVIGVAGLTAQSSRLQILMQQKREYAREMLTAVTLSNWAELEQLAGGLLRIAEDPAWAPLRSPQYAEHSAAFLSAIQSLLDAARRRDTAAAPLAYVSLTMSCVQCHRQVRGVAAHPVPLTLGPR